MISERNRAKNVWSINPWNYRYFVQTSFCTRAVVMLLWMTHIDTTIIRKTSESSSTEPDRVVGREFSHCGHFIERFVIPDRDVYRYTRTFKISVRYQPAHVVFRSGGAQNPCPSAASTTIRHETFLHLTFRILCPITRVLCVKSDVTQYCNNGRSVGTRIDTRDRLLWSHNVCNKYTLTRHNHTQS